MTTVKIEKKITDITVSKIPPNEVISSGVPREQNCAWIYPTLQDGILHVNEDGLYTRNEKYWATNAEAIITHESVHEALQELFPNCPPAHLWFDRWFTGIEKTHFLLTCDFQWLTQRWHWRNGKWIKKRFL